MKPIYDSDIPCSTCGGYPSLIRQEDLSGNKLHMWVIKCNNCPKCLGVFDSTIKAVEKWEKHNARNSLSTHEYYKSGKYEAIDIIEAYCLNFCLGNVIKYVLRAGKKSPDALPDLKKALSYIEREIKRLEQESEKPSP